MLTSQNKLCPKVCVVVLNYKNYQDTIECLESLGSVTYPNTEVIVVDNDSQNDSLMIIRESLSARNIDHTMINEDAIETCVHNMAKTILLQSFSNRGYAAGNNLGIRTALAKGADYILLLNNDTRVNNLFLDPLVGYAEKHSSIGAVGPKILNEDGDVELTCARRRPTRMFYFFGDGIVRKLFPNNYWRRRHFHQGEYFFDHAKEVDILSGACMLIKAAVFRQIGLLDENTFLYFEECILHERMRLAGWTQAVVPESTIIHKGGRSTSARLPEHIRKAKQESRQYYLTHYRHFGRFTMLLIMLLRWRPGTIIQSIWKHDIYSRVLLSKYLRKK